MRRVAAALLLLFGRSAAGVDFAAGPRDVHLDVTTTTMAAWRFSNGNRSACDDDYGEALQRLSVSASSGQWSAGARLDGAVFFATPTASSETGGPRCYPGELEHRYRAALMPEKLWGSYRGRVFELTAGDSYVSFGRGLNLSLRQLDPLGVDTSERGVRLGVATRELTAIAVAGFTNINNLDQATGRWADDPNDFVAGAHVLGQLTEGVKLGASTTAFFFREGPNAARGSPAYGERWFSSGPVLDAPRLLSWLGLFVEGTVQQRDAPGGKRVSAAGLYGSATVRLGPVTALLEGKAYGDLAVVQPRFESTEFQVVQYTSLPTLERLLQPLEHPQRNIWGGRLRVDVAVTPALGLYVNDALFRDGSGYLDPATSDIATATVHDPYAGADVRLGRVRVAAQAGVRLVMLPGRAAPLRSDGHFELSVTGDLGRGASIELHAWHWERTRELPFSTQSWREGTASLSFRKRPYVAVAGLLDYTTEPGQPGWWYPAGSLEIDFTPSSNLRLFAGASRGGLRCISGVCRVFPPFAGVRATLTLRF